MPGKSAKPSPATASPATASPATASPEPKARDTSGRLAPASRDGRTRLRRAPRSEPRAGSALQLPAAPQREHFAQRLLAFYRKSARKLPWRDNPTAYAVWVSEMMLQQTQVATVLPYFDRWMRRFPTLEALASAPQEEVLGTWQGLGYYARARALHAGARHVLQVFDGVMPQKASELQKLPGIGPYTAGAISSIAFEQPAPLVDGNVIRVLCRYFGLFGSPTHQPLKAFLWQLAEALIPVGHARDFNQALMEFGATCCTPKTPLCLQCPLRESCYALTRGAVGQLPELPERPKVTALTNVAVLVRRRGRVLVGQLPENASRWASMWQFPNVDVASGETEEAAVRRALQTWFGLEAVAGARLHTVKHSVTRYRITVHLYEASAEGRPEALTCQRLAWQDATGLVQLAMPAAHRRLASLAIE